MPTESICIKRLSIKERGTNKKNPVSFYNFCFISLMSSFSLNIGFIGLKKDQIVGRPTTYITHNTLTFSFLRNPSAGDLLLGDKGQGHFCKQPGFFSNPKSEEESDHLGNLSPLSCSHGPSIFLHIFLFSTKSLSNS